MRMKLAGVMATAVLVAAVIVFLFVQAMVGVPFVRLKGSSSTAGARTPMTRPAVMWRPPVADASATR